MPTECSAAAGFFMAKYNADTGTGGLVALLPGGMYEDAVPLGMAVTYPLAVFSLSSAFDVRVDGGNERLLTPSVYLVRAIGKGEGYSHSGAEAGAARLDAVLHMATTSTVQYCVRERPFSRSYTINGVTYYERGGFYRLDIHGG